jgi:hypothetical protein
VAAAAAVSAGAGRTRAAAVVAVVVAAAVAAGEGVAGDEWSEILPSSEKMLQATFGSRQTPHALF